MDDKTGRFDKLMLIPLDFAELIVLHALTLVKH